MQFGAMNFPVAPLLDEIETFSHMQFDYLELTMDPPMAHHHLLSSNTNAIKKSLRDNKLDLVCHLPTFVSTADLTDSLRKASVKEMCDSLSVAHELGAQKAVIHPSTVTGMGGYVLETVKRYLFDFLSEMVLVASQLPVVLCLENMFPRNIFGVEPDDLSELFNTFPTLKFTLDTGHAHINDRGGYRLLKLLELFGDRLGHLHFSDNHGVRDEHLAIGEGTIDFVKLIRMLKSTGYNETITLEIFDDNRQKLISSRQRVRDMCARF